MVGGGATATADRDWHEVWVNSDRATQLQTDLESMHAEGRSQPASTDAEETAEFATSWAYQTKSLIARGFSDQFRDPDYLIAKLMLAIFAGMFIRLSRMFLC